MTPAEDTRFVILSTARTGTNLTIELLNSHPDCFCGYEIFSRMHYAGNTMPWFLDDIPTDQALCALREADPVGLIDRLDCLTRARGRRAVGFKLMYVEAEERPLVRDYIFSNPQVRVIHVHRRNLLRRLVSERRAQSTGRWWVEQGEDAPVPQVRLTLEEILWDVAKVRGHERAYAKLDETHSVLHLDYEDIATDLFGTAQRIWRFLGLREWSSLAVRTAKTGTDPLNEAIENYDELRQQLRDLQAFLD